MTATARQASKTPAKQDSGKAVKERAILVELLGPFDGEPRLHHYESACTVLAAKADEVMLKAGAHRDKAVELLTETVLDDSPEIFAAIESNNEAAERAEADAEDLRRRLAFFQGRASKAKTEATAAQIEAMRDQVDTAGGQAITGGASIDASIDGVVAGLYALEGPLKALFQTSPRQIVNMPQVTATFLFDLLKRRIDAHARGTRPLPSAKQAMADVAAVARRSFDEQHPLQEA